MGFLRENRVIYETENLCVITFWNPNGMSMNDTKNENRWEIPNFIKRMMLVNIRFYTIRYCYNYLQLLLLYSYYDSVTGRSPLGPPFWAPSWASLGVTFVWSNVNHIASHPRTE